MVETISFLLGAGFSVLVYFLSIRPLPEPASRKLVYFVISSIGITGMVFLIGVVSSHVLGGKQ